ncbi:MAG: hypothetical protein ACFE8L_02410 [Candidatus Hodarchaeota archaeon]
MSKEEFTQLVDSSFDKGTPLWIYTKDYIYGMVPADNDRWVEISYTFEDPEEPLFTTERNADLSFQFLFEELSKGVSFYVEDFNVQKIKDFAKGLEGKPGSDKINAVINELINNSANYSSNLPIIRSKNELSSLKNKI